MTAANDAAARMVPPHSMEAEQAVLGALLLDNRAHDRVADVLRPAHFYRAEHRTIYQAVEGLIVASRPADIITVHARLAADGAAQDVGGMVYLQQLADSVAGAGSARAYAEIVHGHWRARALVALGRQLADDACQLGTDAAAGDALIDRAALALLDLQQGGAADEPVRVDELMPAWLDALEDRAQGRDDAMSLGLHDVDRVLSGGLRRTEFMVLGARPSMGKSALMNVIAQAVARQVPVLACSMEDSLQMLLSRAIAAAGRVNLADIRRPDRAPDSMWAGVSDGVDALRPLQLYLDDRPALALRDVRRKAMQVRRRAGDLGLLVLDYLQLMEGEGETRAYELASIARGLKRLAKELNCAVLLLSQLSREADKTDGPPRIDHLAESGGIEQAADIIGLLWREARRKPKPDNKHRAQIEFVKVKNGPTDTVQLHFSGAHQRFSDAEVAHA